MPIKVGPELKNVNSVDHRKAMTVTEGMTDDQKVAVALESIKYKAMEYYVKNKDRKDLPFGNIQLNDAIAWYDWLLELDSDNAASVLLLALAEACEE